MRARGYFERLSAMSPDHPSLQAFEKQIGEPVRPRDGAVEARDAVPPSLPAAAKARRRRRRPSEPAAAPPPEPVARPSRRRVAAKAARGTSRCSRRAQQSADDAKIAELRALADKQEGAKRYNEFVRTLMQLAAIVPEHGREGRPLPTRGRSLHQQVRQPGRGGEGLRGRSSRSTEENAKAIDFLRQMYEKRRDWEKLLGLQRREAERLPPGPSARRALLEIAKLATERVKKPDVCIELWHEVIELRSRERRGARQLSAVSTSAPRISTSSRQRPREAGRGHLRQRAADPDPRQARQRSTAIV